MAGPSNIGSGNVDFTVTGFFDGGVMVSLTFIGPTAATTETMGFTNLDSVQFARTSDEGIDNIELAHPEPASLLLLVAGFAGLAWRSFGDAASRASDPRRLASRAQLHRRRSFS